VLEHYQKQKLHLHLPIDLQIPLLGIFPADKKIHIYKAIHCCHKDLLWGGRETRWDHFYLVFIF
jgi:hypothetical protein